MLHDGQQALVVDPGDAQPVFDALQHEGVQLQAILVTTTTAITPAAWQHCGHPRVPRSMARPEKTFPDP